MNNYQTEDLAASIELVILPETSDRYGVNASTLDLSATLRKFDRAYRARNYRTRPGRLDIERATANFTARWNRDVLTESVIATVNEIDFEVRNVECSNGIISGHVVIGDETVAYASVQTGGRSIYGDLRATIDWRTGF